MESKANAPDQKLNRDVLYTMQAWEMTRNFFEMFCDDINLQLEASFVLWGEGICFLGSFCLVPVINADMQ